MKYAPGASFCATQRRMPLFQSTNAVISAVCRYETAPSNPDLPYLCLIHQWRSVAAAQPVHGSEPRKTSGALGPPPFVFFSVPMGVLRFRCEEAISASTWASGVAICQVLLRATFVETFSREKPGVRDVFFV